MLEYGDDLGTVLSRPGMPGNRHQGPLATTPARGLHTSPSQTRHSPPVPTRNQAGHHHRDRMPNNPKQPNTKLGCAILLGLTALIGGCTAVVFSGDDTSDDKPLDESAAVMCEQFVEKRLKSPGSAQFPGVTDPDYAETTVLSGTKPWKYKVEGHVDSDNSFGASKRNTYTCTVSTKNGDTWNLDDMQMTER